ncbi:MAG: diaminopimelate epimerase [Betaproteobacteria bacterium]|nr:diaminopimelate epimerase [Betaproteobacteria bacterium]
MKLAFTKMHGAGNDFVVLDAVMQPLALGAEQIRRLADRRFGVGCDQVLVVERASAEGSRAGADFRYRIFNADGGEVEQCGNGARCFVKFVHAKGLTAKREIAVETLGGLIRPRLEDDGEVSVDMGAPVFEFARVPFAGELAGMMQRLDLGDGETVEVAVLSMGNPHAVQRVPDAEAAPVARQGPAIERHALFPRRVNAGFMQVLDAHAIALRVYERGTGETLACGTGACAAVVAGIRQGRLQTPVEVRTRGGRLTIAWAGGDNAVWMKGPAQSVFEGVVET